MRPAADEFERRRRVLTDRMAAAELDACVIFGASSIHYFTGFSYIAGERPLVVVIRTDGQTFGIVPRLEREHFELRGSADRVDDYDEYPGTRHPMVVIAETIARSGLGSSRLGVDAAGPSSRNGYAGPSLPEVLPHARFEPVRALLEDIRRIKTEVEVAAIRSSLEWAEHAHRLLQGRVSAGRRELDIAVAASYQATRDLLEALGGDYDPGSWVLLGATAGFRGQIGPGAALPHAMYSNRALEAGDVLVTGASAKCWGYGPAVERTMFVGPPPDESRRLFELMLGAQEVAFGAIGPGVTCSAVDSAVRSYFREHDLMELWRHHTGHSFGLESHEAPYLDVGDDTMLEPGMVFAVEPGLYQPGLGGFRHQDIVLVTEDGHERLTSYPRDLESMTCVS